MAFQRPFLGTFVAQLTVVASMWYKVQDKVRDRLGDNCCAIDVPLQMDHSENVQPAGICPLHWRRPLGHCFPYVNRHDLRGVVLHGMVGHCDR